MNMLSIAPIELKSAHKKKNPT